jgi:hypothetical protein
MSARTITGKNYTFYYTLNAAEYNKFIELLETTLENKYAAFIIVLLTALNNDLNAMLRVLNAGSSKDAKVFPSLLYSNVLLLIKEAIILASYNSSNSVSAMANSERYRFADIDKNTINRTFKKYNIETQ